MTRLEALILISYSSCFFLLGGGTPTSFELRMTPSWAARARPPGQCTAIRRGRGCGTNVFSYCYVGVGCSFQQAGWRWPRSGRVTTQTISLPYSPHISDSFVPVAPQVTEQDSRLCRLAGRGARRPVTPRAWLCYRALRRADGRDVRVLSRRISPGRVSLAAGLRRKRGRMGKMGAVFRPIRPHGPPEDIAVALIKDIK